MKGQLTMTAILQTDDAINRVSGLKAQPEPGRTLLYDCQRDNADLAAGRVVLIRDDGGREVKGIKNGRSG